MKKTLLVLTLLSQFTFAKTSDFGDFCYNNSCSYQQEILWQNYQEISGLEVNQTELFVGDCYHTSPMYSNKYRHHAAVLLEKIDGSLYMNPIFSFYAKENPYRNWTISTAREELSDRFSSVKKVTLENEYGYVDMNPNHPQFLMYWLKKEANMNSLSIVGLWDIRHKLICNLTKK